MPTSHPRLLEVFKRCRGGFAGTLLVVLGACFGQGEAAATERLWVSSVPTSVTAETTAFLTTKAKDGQFIGGFFRGSLVRGSYDVFDWTPDGEQAATIRFLQDGRTHRLRFEACTPDPKFDYCLLVHGDPTRTRRYQSRKRWTVRRGRNKAELSATITRLMAEELDVSR